VKEQKKEKKRHHEHTFTTGRRLDVSECRNRKTESGHFAMVDCSARCANVSKPTNCAISCRTRSSLRLQLLVLCEKEMFLLAAEEAVAGMWAVAAIIS